MLQTMDNETMKKTINVLLVEDNGADIRLVTEYLKEDGNYNFNITYSNCLAKALLEIKNAELQLDVVILDLGLPDCTGLETFKRIWTETEQDSMLPIIVLTGGATLKGGNLRFCIDESQSFLFKGDLDSKVLVDSILRAIERQAAKKKVMLLMNEMRNRDLNKLQERR